MSSAKKETERVPCPACGARDACPFHVERGWRYVRCRRCRTVYLSPRPTSQGVRDHYRDYLPEDPEAIRDWERSQKPLILRAVRLLARRLPPGASVLEVGSGYGFLGAALIESGLKAEGVEISPTGIRHARALGLDVHRGTLEELALPGDRFHALCGFYVIEHLDDPAGFLREARRVLRPGGLLVLRWPQTAPLIRWCRFLGLRYDLYDAPSHLTDFTPESLAGLLRRCGFTAIETRTAGSTRPPGMIPRVAGILGAFLGEALFFLSRKRFLAPGASKTTIAVKG